MAQIRLWANPRENAIYDLPYVCMKCGAEAMTVKKKQFQWYPPWIYALIFAGLLPFAIVAMIMTKRKTVEIPFCDQHKNHFLMRMLGALGGVLALVAVGFVTTMVAIAAQGPNQNDDVGPFVCMAWFGLLIVFAIAMAIINILTTIRPTEITDRDITLTNVSPEFVRAMEEEEAELDRDIDRDVGDRWRKKRGPDRRPDDDRYERRGDRPPPRRGTDITEGDEE